jgi:hypothetical protein
MDWDKRKSILIMYFFPSFSVGFLVFGSPLIPKRWCFWYSDMREKTDRKVAKTHPHSKISLRRNMTRGVVHGIF